MYSSYPTLYDHEFLVHLHFDLMVILAFALRTFSFQGKVVLRNLSFLHNIPSSNPKECCNIFCEDGEIARRLSYHYYMVLK